MLPDAYGQNQQIVVDKSNNTLTAPEGSGYLWFCNNHKLDIQGSELKIMKAGVYTLKMKDKKGNTVTLTKRVKFDENGNIITIFTIGDSTVQNYTQDYYPRTGWGQVLQHFFNKEVEVINMAVGGTSAKSFYNDFWTSIQEVLQANDYVFIQFGINDAHTDSARHTDPFTTFKEYLTKMVKETLEKGAQPVLVATLRRNAWQETNPPVLEDAYHDYPIASRQLANELNVPLIDLDEITALLLESLGYDYTTSFIYMHVKPGEYPNFPNGTADDVHFQETGAVEMARLIVEAVAKMNGNKTMKKLIPCIKPMFEVAVTTNFPGGAVVTRTTNYPEGAPVTLKAQTKPGYAFIEWQNSDRERIDSTKIVQFVMGSSPLSFKVILDNNPQHLDCNGDNYGTAYVDDCGICVGGTTGLYPCVTSFSNDTFCICPVHSGLYIDQKDSVTQQDFTNDKSQSWIFLKEKNYYTIQNVESGLFLGFSKSVSGQRVTTFAEPSLWRVEYLGEEIYQLIPASNNAVTIDVYGKHATAGTKLTLYMRNSNNNQKFRLISK